MKVSYQWLKEIVDINADAKKVANTLTMAGLQVETIYQTGIGKADVVVVEIKSIEKHPNADNLFIVKVDAGKFNEKQIITNVKGLVQGQKVLAALEGVKLATGLEIKKTKLKGIESEGMFVGYEELGINQKSEFLFFLDKNMKNGTNFNEVLPFNDSVIDIELTANRGDCLGMIGVSREIKALFNKELKVFETDYKTIPEKAADIFKVEIKSSNCFRYCGGVIVDINIKPSPYWMQMRLIKAGIRPINNVVDITNYILLECNQPLHAFDMDKINNKNIIVRDGKENEELVTLDNVKRILDKNDMIIADPKTGHCLAGIMGGAISEVTDSTKNIFLEAAFFKPEVIRKTSKKTGLRSESSYRFERKIDIENVDWALKRALYFFDKLEVGKVCSGIIDVYPNKQPKKKLNITAEWINNKLGSDIKKEKIIEILSKLDFIIEDNKNNLALTIPSWRNDITIKEDIAEEVARIYGYNNIKHSHVPSYQAAARTKTQENIRILRNLLYQSGCNETINLSFVGTSLFDKMLLQQNHDFRKIINLDIQLSEEWSGLRNSLMPGMIRTASFNATRQIKSLSFFEIGNVFIDTKKEFPDEDKRICILVAGNKKFKDYKDNEEFYDFYDIKGILDYILDYFKVNSRFVQSNEAIFHPFQQAKVLINNIDAGIIGKLHPLICDSFDIDFNVFIFEISTGILFENATDRIVYKEVPRFPSSVRDLAIVVDNNIKSVDIINAINNSKNELLQNVKIFDIYSGENIEKGKYSIAITMEFNKISSTLTDKEIDDAVSKILSVLQEKCRAKIR